jgi:transposase
MKKRKKRRKTSKKPKGVSTNDLIRHNLNAAGIDIGSEDLFVCVPEDRDEPNIRSFKTFTEDLRRLALWLKQCNIETVAMESTGVLWVPLFELLESQGFEVFLVNPHELKKSKKTDVIDCAWLQQMHSYGLLAPSFRPPDQICALRSLVRHRDDLVGCRAAHIQHMQKSLQQMNVRLENVISDITGATGMTIIRAIIRGERDLDLLSSYRDPSCKNSQEVIRKSLEGNYRTEHLFTLKQAVELFDVYTAQILACDQEIGKLYTQLTPPTNGASTKGNAPSKTNTKRCHKRKNHPPYDLQDYLRALCGVDLTAIDGMGPLTAQTLLTEAGTDISKFRTVKHWASWLGLAPNNRYSAGKRLRPLRTLSANRAGQALREAARSLHHSNSFLGSYYRRMKSIHGPAKANKLTAHKIARIIYFMLLTKQEYDETLFQRLEDKRRDKVISSLNRKAKQYGFTLVATNA